MLDFCKLILYLTFFCVLCMFYGMPIHIIRDVAITIRSFYKRITDFVRYRHATRDMNERYPDATADEIVREDVCIICREEMRAWRQPDQQAAQVADANRIATHSVDERLRPKKLPCGHILHFACLRSWLERQQNCPTCRRPVLATGTIARNGGQAQLVEFARAHAQANQLHRGAPAQGNGEQPNVGQNRIRMLNLGPFRLGFGAGQDVRGLARQLNQQQPGPPVDAPGPNHGAVQQFGFGFGFGRQPPAVHHPTTAQFSPTNTQTQLHQIEQQLIREINSLRMQADQLHLVRALQGELARLRIAQANPGANVNGGLSMINHYRTHPQQIPAMPSMPPMPPLPAAHAFAPSQYQSAMGAGHQDLPPGMTLPEGWTVLPLQRMPFMTDSAPSMPMSFTQNSILDPPFLSSSATSQSVNNPSASSDLQADPLQPGDQSARVAARGMHGNTLDALASTMPSASRSQDVDGQISSEPRESMPTQSNGTQDRDGGVQSSNIKNTSITAISNPTDLAENVAPVSSPISIPAWRGNDTALEDGQSSNRTDTKSVGESSEEQSTSATISRQAKGKGKAATVEDYIEDVD